MNTLIEIKNLYAGYNGKAVIKDVSLNIYENDFLGIIGPNGGGKTTLVKIILGLLCPQKGEINYYHNEQKVKEIRMGYLPQYNMIDKKFPISVYEVILSGLSRDKSFLKPYNDSQHAHAKNTIHRMGLDGLENRPIGSLSGGQLQRVLLGRALVSKPEVLVLDEPNTYIDKKFEAHLYKILEEINNECAIILVSHDIGTVVQNVKSIACVNETLHYHPDPGISGEWINEHFGCPIELVGHGDIPHRILKSHND
jgi:zinc transport system ATP-binding protein